MSFHLFSRVLLTAIEPVMGFLHTYGIVSRVTMQCENDGAVGHAHGKTDQIPAIRRSVAALGMGAGPHFELTQKSERRDAFWDVVVLFDQVLTRPCCLFLSRQLRCAWVCQHPSATNPQPAMINRSWLHEFRKPSTATVCARIRF